MAEGTSDRTLVGWSLALREIGLASVSAGFETNPSEDFSSLERLGLPRYEAFQFTVRQFFDNFKTLLDTFRHALYYVVLIPQRPADQKFSKIALSSLTEVRRFVEVTLADHDADYLVKISEFEENVYGGSIMSENGCVIIELTDGLQSGLAYGVTSVDTGLLTEYSISMKYSTAVVDRRKLMWNALSHIRGECARSAATHKIRGLPFLRGYFEFAYTSSALRAGLRLVFIDHKPGVGFSRLSKINELSGFVL